MEKTHFGYQTIDKNKKSSQVQSVFTNVAPNYDFMNDVMSFRLHRIWKDVLINMLNPHQNMHLLDVAGGTGDIATRFFKRTENKGKVTICDFTHSMLQEGQKNLPDDLPISWICGDAQKLPFCNNSFNAYTISFGIRNVTCIQEALQEAFRVLKPGGHFLCLEFSNPKLPVFKQIYDLYSFKLIPLLGEYIAKDRASYQYLVESIRKFPAPGKYKLMIENAGFKLAQYRVLTGGIVTIHEAWKI